MEVSVKLISSSTDLFAKVWMIRNRISFFKKCVGRFNVYQHRVSGRVSDRELLGVVFRESAVWVFVPHDQKLKMNWYWGKSRADAVSGFLRATGREVIDHEA